MTDTLGGSEPDPDFEAQFAQLVREVQQGRPAAVHEPSARARMLQNRWREEPPPTTPWRGEHPTVGDATVRGRARGPAPTPLAPRTRPGFGRPRAWSRPRRGDYGRGRQGARAWVRKALIAVIVGAVVFAVIETVVQDHTRAAAAGAERGRIGARFSAGSA
ncbi:hypothetical protein KDL01_07215 [Actinospica durhamensis]|uniref:Uncharacterized protein n=1 Tax=Actinospica durhamensis TaxID=1508375 RepID=A0A941EKX0_9ACTN|nr:hypothetical protein [Actinospica durhamensis]MBR7833046.1 hypothetical protein [Actinospica durhamensis]